MRALTDTRSDIAAGVRGATERGCAALLRLQHEEGWWKGPLETNVSMDAEDILLREFLGIREPEGTAKSAAWIRQNQRSDGTWSNFYGGPGDLSTSIEAYVALRLAGDDPQAAHMQGAVRFIRENGGIEAARVFTHIWIALFGLWPWERVPAIPPELNLLPSWFPFNPYDFACWARQTIVALTVVWAQKPVHPVPFTIDELKTGRTPPRRLSPASVETYLLLLDGMLRAAEKLPWKPLRQRSLVKALEWIADRQEADGSWGGIQPPWVYSLIALVLSGRSLDDPAVAKGLQGLAGFTIETEHSRWLEACQSPVWDTALAMLALSDCGLPGDHPSMLAAARWLVKEEVCVVGDWAVKRDLAPGGWAFEFANDNYPDIDDTAFVVMALRRVDRHAFEAGGGAPAGGRPDLVGAIERGIRWVVGMETNGGGWAAFDADNTRQLCARLPFCDFGAVIDPPSADVTAHVLEMLAEEQGDRTPAFERGVRWLLREQEPDGAWFGRWGVNYVYGVGAVLPALIKAGLPAEHPSVRAAVRWLKSHQNPDGGWGEDIRSYSEAAWRGRGTSTPSQTAWALMALLAAKDRGTETARGLRYLVEEQREDGTWDEPFYTGTGFPGDFYINYHLYRMVFPLMALGRSLQPNGSL